MASDLGTGHLWIHSNKSSRLASWRYGSLRHPDLSKIIALQQGPSDSYGTDQCFGNICRFPGRIHEPKIRYFSFLITKNLCVLLSLADSTSIQLLVTSRPNQGLNPSLLLHLSESPEHVEVDIEGYMQTAVRQLAVVREFSEDLRDAITEMILARSSEGFLWLQLVLQRISEARTARDRLENLPRGLVEAYSDFFSGRTSFTDVNRRRTLYFVTITEAPLQAKGVSTLSALSQCRECKSQTESTDMR